MPLEDAEAALRWLGRYLTEASPRLQHLRKESRVATLAEALLDGLPRPV
jgi:hypothetical protein